jgi:hypothetical protein
MRQSIRTTFIATGASVLFYRAALPLSRKTLTFVSGIIRRHRISTGSCQRKLNHGQQALLVLAYLRKGETLAADRPFYSGKHKKHGMNLQVIASPDGGILWVSGALPGSVHDKKAEWIWGVLNELEAAGLVTLAIRATRAPRPRGSRTRGRTSPTLGNRPISPTRNYGHPASARTPSSRPGTSWTSSAAAPGERETRQGYPRMQIREANAG